VKCEHQFGFETFQISVPSLPPGVVINDPKNLEYVFKNEGIFCKGDFFKRRSWDLFGTALSFSCYCLHAYSVQAMGSSMPMESCGKSSERLAYIF
jgi:hypothetical protein